MTTLLFLPDGADDADFRWMRFGEGGLLARGAGVPAGDDPVVAVVPAEAVALHWAELPARSPAQATAAARLLAAEASAAPVGELHVAVGAQEEGATERPIGVVGAGAMAGWLAMLARAGVDPVAVVPAPMLLPRPEQGYVRAEIAGRGVVRGRTSGFADEARLTELVTADSPPVPLNRGALDAALVAAAAGPALDLRQGPFARRRGFAIDWPLVRRLAVLALAILAVTLAISLVRLAKYSFAADATEQRADALAATGLPRGETITDPDRQLAERLGRTRGPGLGFTTTAAAVYAAVRSVPGTEVTAMDFTPDGAMRVTVSAEREALATDLLRAFQRAGLAARASTFTTGGGRVTGELTVSPR
ncbi:type II secretion system protein GspL [Sphingomonas rubra]|uniref:General secretion pathway protein L n=1 Tax=Sphingomonas rubra TaxID=634430 RepID=A0A1I5SUG3_9SPHN|nr:type II secretion system protein GspL [Sphingomonas rubra]SFP74405.1 general secretion pathway protein L [Sphingomonas rubra]